MDEPGFIDPPEGVEVIWRASVSFGSYYEPLIGTSLHKSREAAERGVKTLTADILARNPQANIHDGLVDWIVIVD